MGGCNGIGIDGTGTAPDDAGNLAPYYKKLSRYSANLALVSEIALASMGGALKRKESISARLGDILSELYLLSAALKRYEEDGRPPADLPLLDWCFETGLFTIETQLKDVLRNFPSRIWAGLLGFWTMPWGRTRRAPSDRLMNKVAASIQEPSATRARITHGVMTGPEGSQAILLERALAETIACDHLYRKLKDADLWDLAQAEHQAVLTSDERRRMEALNALIQRIIRVDDFEPAELTR